MYLFDSTVLRVVEDKDITYEVWNGITSKHQETKRENYLKSKEASN